MAALQSDSADRMPAVNVTTGEVLDDEPADVTGQVGSDPVAQAAANGSSAS